MEIGYSFLICKILTNFMEQSVRQLIKKFLDLSLFYDG